MSVKIQIKRSTAASWHSANPTLASGEFGYETDTKRLKIGSGALWDDTPYFVHENTKLDNLSDVTVTSVSDGDFLRFNSSGSVWVNDAVNLSTDTIGDYVQSLVQGTGLTITNNSGEGSTPTIAIGQSVATTASVQFAKVNTTGDITVGGNLTVNGTTTTLNTENLTIEDNFITLNSNVSASPSLNAGIEVERGLLSNVILRWNETTEKWQVSEDGESYYDIINSSSLEDRLNTFSYANDARLATYTVLPNSPTYTAGTLDQDGGYGIGATLESSANARLVVDGVEANNNNRILVQNQIDGKQNGIYEVTAQGSAGSHWILTRADDVNGSHPNQIHRGENLDCQEGDKNSNQTFVISSSGTGTNGAHIIGTDYIQFAQITGIYSFTAGNGLTTLDNTLNIATANSERIVVSANSIDLAEIVQDDVSGSPSLVLVSSIERDGYGRVLGVTTSDAQVTLGSNTTGNYVASLVAGTGISVSEITGEGSTPTVAIGQDVSTSASVTFVNVNAHITGDVTGNADTATALDNARIISLSGDVSGSVSFDGSQNVDIAATIQPNSVALGSDTTGAYVDSLVAGTGVSITNNSGEGATPGIAIGQDVATSASVQFASVTAPLVGNASTASALQTSRTIALSGDVSGSVSFDGSASAEITATIQPNSVALGTDTTGNYMSDLTQGTGVTITHTPGEGSNATIAIGQAVATSSSVTFAAVTAPVIGNASTASALETTRTISLTGDVSGSVSFNGSADASISATIQPNSVALGADTTGNYVNDLTAGTGVTVTHTPGEGSSPTVAIGQAVGTSASVTFAHVAADVTGKLTGNADTASTLKNARTISLGGDLSGSASFDGSQNVTITASIEAESFSLGNADDVTITSVTQDDVLVWNGTAWVNQNSIHLKSITNSTDSDSGALIVDGGIGIKGDIHTDGVIHAGTLPTVSLDNAVAYFSGNESGVVQLGLQNQSSASVSSADYVATADNGNDTSKYLDLGINSSTYADPDYSATGANDGYLYVDGGHLVIGTKTGDKDIKFNIGGTQSTDIMGTWSETVLDIATDLSVSGSASFGNIDTENATVNALTADSGLFDTPSASVVAAIIKGASGQTANLTEWKNSAGTTLAHVDKDGKITSPLFIGTNVGNLSFFGINNTGSTISKGAPVVLTGLDSPSGNPTMTVANVADPTKMPAAGLAGADILAGQTGEVVIIGQLHGVDTSSYSYNQILYVDGAGLLTTTKPSNPSHSVQPIGNVEKVATAINDGTILVNCTGTYADSPNTIAIPGSVTASAGFYGSGANITSLNANNLSAGTVPSARLSLTTSDIPTLTASKISDFATTAKGYTLDSFAVPVAAVAMNNQKITGMADPTTGSDAATKTYVDNLSSGLRIKQAVNWATNAILPNSPTYFDGAADSSQGLGDGAYMTSATNTRLSVDGSNVSTGQRVLVKNQATASHNGIYYVTAQGGGGNVWRLTRADDSNNTPAGEVRKGDYVSVLTGSANAGTSWTIENDGTATTPLNGIKIGTDAINWIQFNGAASYVAGGGMTLSGTTFDVATASSDRIVINADSIDLATVSRSDTSGSPGGSRITAITTDSYGRVTGTTSSAQADATTTTKGIASFDSGDFSVSSGAVTIKSGGVGNTQLENSSVTIGSTSVSLGATASSLTGLSSVSATTFTGNLTGSVSGNATSVTNGVYTTDTGTVTNTMLAGSIADSKLSTISTAGKVSNSATTATASNTASAIVARDASGNFTAGTITADLSGNASTATSATSATNATNAAITDTTTTAGTYYPVFSSTSTGNSVLRTDSTGLTYNPSTNALTATTFSGALSGNASTVTNGVYTTSSINALADVDTVSASPTTGQFLKWNGTNWVPDSVPTINALDDIGDVSASAPTIGDFLKWNGSAWISSAGGASTLDGLTDVTAPSPSTGDFLKWNGSAWVNQSGVVTTSDTGTVTSAMISNGTIVNADISTSAAIAHSKLADATAGQVLLGTTTSGVITATTLSGDVTITGSGVTSIASGVIVNADVSASAAIALSKLESGTSAQVVLANSSGVPTYTSVSGDVTITNAGATSIKSNVALSGAPTAATATAGTNTTQIATTAFTTTAVRDSLIRFYMEVM
jgi:hypothetical protein